MNHKTPKNSQGFTLIEMMVAVSIFLKRLCLISS
ncbi:hypothetical protein COS18_04485 [Candidatus Falkowbacteria bacterium CG02_land_8_20_14_3_00_36_14]|uniref:Prepilin-type N-terminal cleavage/methylation domain-containing protein n=1 Tax=Candidatus Falkowbacteria bacterium CG02_land_8_20_14_3_00_36_14 TaxID=1974560 RepID=A0A2M7DLK7_9BACT|nr:MAG: hypothetical protein COS18_04485 [Candidatus Falkowbacteria bacterium CG02_land_8_20_14_3_00_36_14]